LEEAGADYVDVVRRPGKRGVPAMMKFIESGRSARPPFAPPFLKAGKLVIAQTANILLYLGGRLRLAPRDEAGRLWVHQGFPSFPHNASNGGEICLEPPADGSCTNRRSP
jgi:glutathione S-transferase